MMDSSIADLLLGKIVFILENEASLLYGLRDEINQIKEELHFMKSFLEDADRKGVHSKTENAWVSSVRDMACEVEDFIDEFVYHANEQRQRRSARYVGFFLKAVHYPEYVLLRHKVAVKLRDINQRIKSIPDMKQRYGVYHLEEENKMEGMTSSYDPNWLKYHSESALFLKDDDLVGIEKAQKKLLRWLINEELERGVISVLGMGGLGLRLLPIPSTSNLSSNILIALLGSLSHDSTRSTSCSDL